MADPQTTEQSIQEQPGTTNIFHVGESNQQSALNATQDMGSLLERLLSVSYLPDEIKQQWVFLCSDDVVLTYLTDRDIAWLMNSYDILELETISALAGHNYNKQMVRELKQLKMIAFAKIKRAYLGKEREAQTKQTTVMQEQRMPEQPVHSQGFWNQAKRAIFGGL